MTPPEQFSGADLRAYVDGELDAAAKVHAYPLQKRQMHRLYDQGVGFKLMGGRLVADKGDSAALFMFEDAKSRRVSLYVRPGMSGGNTKLRFIAEHGMAAFYWTNGPLSYALSGEMSQGDLLSLVQMVHDDLTSRSS